MIKVNSGGNLLLIFTRNPRLGKVKTRLAKDIGDQKALEVYRELLRITASVALKVPCFRLVSYDTALEDNDAFNPAYFMKDVQVGADLGERLSEAFTAAFRTGFASVVCIGSDCPSLNEEIINTAFEQLKSHDLSVGPARDGGYYLIGMKKAHYQLFKNKLWGSENVLLDTLLDARNLGLSYYLLPTLSDIDAVSDLTPELRALTDKP
jgi:rSAM/selenodomain-associated transferase 1